MARSALVGGFLADAPRREASTTNAEREDENIIVKDIQGSNEREGRWVGRWGTDRDNRWDPVLLNNERWMSQVGSTKRTKGDAEEVSLT